MTRRDLFGRLAGAVGAALGVSATESRILKPWDGQPLTPVPLPEGSLVFRTKRLRFVPRLTPELLADMEASQIFHKAWVNQLEKSFGPQVIGTT